MKKTNPYKQPCATCRNFIPSLGYCQAIEDDVKPQWTGCCRWEDKEDEDDEETDNPDD